MAQKFWFLPLDCFILTQCYLLLPTDVKWKNTVEKNDRNSCSDPGEPLILTTYIENNNTQEGRKLARVPFTEKDFNITSYSGFFTVSKKFNSNLFFWYFPPTQPSSEMAPVVLWLQGGPGSSSLYGLFHENGPLKVLNGSFYERDVNWAKTNHMIYIDNPVGTGFSFFNNTDGFCRNQTQIGEQLYFAMTQFFQLFPELQNNAFYITGESYGGKYVPTLGLTIHTKNPTANVKINLKGMAIGNGFTDPINQLVYSDYLYGLGLLDETQRNAIQKFEKNATFLIQNQDWSKACNEFGNILGTIMVNYTSLGVNEVYNYVKKRDKDQEYEFVKKIVENSTRKDIHVGNVLFKDEREDRTVRGALREDLMKSVAHILPELLNHYHILVYIGQVDIIVPYPSIVNYLRKLKFNGSDEYATAPRHVWKVNGHVAGKWKRAGNLTELFVRHAGHMVSADQPEWAFDIISMLTT